MAKRGRPRHPDILTPREWEVLALVREGLSNEQIAERLGITERTARFHVSEIMSKLGLSTRQEAAAWQPEERRPWWSLFSWPLRSEWLAWSIGGTIVVAGVAAAAVLLWAILHTHARPPHVTGAATPAQTEPVLSARASALAVGQAHACAVVEGSVFCWGQSYDYAAARVGGVPGSVTSVASGTDYSCALLSAGTVRCWGENGLGQLGNDGSSSVSVPADQPSEVTGLTDIVAISAGANHTCALSSSGAVKCWGDNTYGQLGDGTTTERDRPVVVIGLDNGVHAIAVGGNFTCALTREAAVECWGSNAEGQLAAATDASCGAPGFVFACNRQPRAVAGISGRVASIAASAEGQHACAITTEQQLECWGTNAVGQLGVQTTATCSSPIALCATTPIAVLGVGHVTAVALGMYHTCAAEAEGGVKCWGDNLFGQLGDGTTTRRLSPVAAKDISEVTALGAGQLNTCALTSSKQVLCWGADGATGAGVPSQESCGCSAVPVAVYGLSPPRDAGTPAQLNQLVWYRTPGGGPVTASSAPVCGDKATAGKYKVPRMLNVVASSGDLRLGLEAEPYPYVAAQVRVVAVGRTPNGWQLSIRVPLILGPIFGVPPNGFPQAEFFLRRLDEQSLVFRYAAELCPQADGSAKGPAALGTDDSKALHLQKELPEIIEYQHGASISAQRAIQIAQTRDGRSTQGVWATLGTAQDFFGKDHIPIVQYGNEPNQVVWLVYLALGDAGGPHRPNHDIATYYQLNATTGEIMQGGGCCIELRYSP